MYITGPGSVVCIHADISAQCRIGTRGGIAVGDSIVAQDENFETEHKRRVKGSAEPLRSL